MKTYRQRVTFYKEFTIKAKDHEEANSILDQKVEAVESAADVRVDMCFDFNEDSHEEE